MVNKIDEEGRTLVISESMLRVDGIPVFKVIERDGKRYVQVCDRDQMRSTCRGSRFVEIPVAIFFDFINNVKL